MKVLTGDQLNTAETALKAFFPQSLQATSASLPSVSLWNSVWSGGLGTGFLIFERPLPSKPVTTLPTQKRDDVLFAEHQSVYGYIFQMNRMKSDPVDVLVDNWPDFTIVVCRPQNKEEGDRFKTIYAFSKDEAALRKMLGRKDFLPWQEYFCLGVDHCFELTVQSAAAAHAGVSAEKICVARQMRLHDLSQLPVLDSNPPFRLSSLDESHLDLVMGAWKFSEGPDSLRMIRNMICNFPSCCLVDEDGMPMAWILTYPTCAIGMLYTVTEHRGKGCAKILISTLARRLHALGCPVYCDIEEENHVSYQLFTKLGFTEEPCYRGAWFRVCNVQ